MDDGKEEREKDKEKYYCQFGYDLDIHFKKYKYKNTLRKWLFEKKKKKMK